MGHRANATFPPGFIGLERVVGRIVDRLGSFVLQHSGTFEGGTAKATWGSNGRYHARFLHQGLSKPSVSGCEHSGPSGPLVDETIAGRAN